MMKAKCLLLVSCTQTVLYWNFCCKYFCIELYVSYIFELYIHIFYIYIHDMVVLSICLTNIIHHKTQHRRIMPSILLDLGSSTVVKKLNSLKISIEFLFMYYGSTLHCCYYVFLLYKLDKVLRFFEKCTREIYLTYVYLLLLHRRFDYHHHHSSNHLLAVQPLKRG